MSLNKNDSIYTTIIRVRFVQQNPAPTGMQGRAVRAHPARFCTAQQRSIPNEEFIVAAIALKDWDFERQSLEFPTGVVRSEKERSPKDHDSWQKSRQLAACCSIYWQGADSLLNRLMDWQEVEVTLVVDQDHAGDSQLRFAFSVCGEVLPHEFGYEPLVKKTTRNYADIIREAGQK